ncbi:MAG: PIN domain-containing protein [Candidatus Aerophobetes bacterium]|nr:PIN domain-containing protein [Candidatus Aerophobetes bacterium]
MEKVKVKILTRLRKYTLLGIDTMAFIYHFEKNENYQPFTTALFSSIESGDIKAVTSMITLLEVLVKPKKEKNNHLVEKYKFLLGTFPNLKMLPLDAKTADVASGLRAEYNSELLRPHGRSFLIQRLPIGNLQRRSPCGVKASLLHGVNSASPLPIAF